MKILVSTNREDLAYEWFCRCLTDYESKYIVQFTINSLCTLVCVPIGPPATLVYVLRRLFKILLDLFQNNSLINCMKTIDF